MTLLKFKTEVKSEGKVCYTIIFKHLKKQKLMNCLVMNEGKTEKIFRVLGNKSF